MTEEERICKTCGPPAQPIGEFYHQQAGRSRASECKTCWYQRMDRNRNRRLELKAGRPRPKYCELCGKHQGLRRLHYDHDHKTEAFRAWLCHPCNLLLGFAQDDPARLEAAAVFLRTGFLAFRD